MKVISTPKAPQAIGAYSQAVRTGDYLYLSGQIPLVPETMEIVEGDFKRQVEQVFANLHAVIEEAGGTFRQVVKLTIYMTDLSNFATVNDVMANCFDEPYPARATVEVAGLPKGVAVEVDAVVALAD